MSPMHTASASFQFGIGIGDKDVGITNAMQAGKKSLTKF